MFERSISDIKAAARLAIINYDQQCRGGFWSRPGKKGITRRANLYQIILDMDSVEVTTSLQAFNKLYRFYYEDKGFSSRLIKQVEQQLLSLLNIEPQHYSRAAADNGVIRSNKDLIQQAVYQISSGFYKHCGDQEMQTFKDDRAVDLAYRLPPSRIANR